MKLQSVRVANFKAIKTATLDIAPITVLVGANGAGKSSLLHGPALLAETAVTGQAMPQPSGQGLDLGDNPRALANGGSGWTVECTWQRDTPQLGSHTLTTTYTLPPQDPPRCSFRVVGIAPDRRPFDLLIDSDQGSRLTLHHASNVASNAGSGTWTVMPQPIGFWSARAAGAQPSAPLAAAAVQQVKSLLDLANGAMAADTVIPALSSFSYIPGNRDIPASTYGVGGRPPRLRSPQDLVSRLLYDRQLRFAVADRCEQTLGFRIDVDFHVNNTASILVQFPNHPEFNVVNVGAGFVQAMWLATCLEDLTTAAAGQESRGDKSAIIPTIAIEEPELHLHPLHQRAIVRLLVAHAQSGFPVILTTQSEHILIALLHAVAGGAMAPADLAVYHVREGTARRCVVTDTGSLEGGLPGFAEVEEGELQAYIDILRSK